MPIRAFLNRWNAILFEVPICAKCSVNMTLIRISPVLHARPVRMERTFECHCGVTLAIEKRRNEGRGFSS